MKKIRRGVFETNSSSMHSISIAGYDDSRVEMDGKLLILDDHIPVDDNGAVTISFGEFGWEERLFHDAGTKASYAATYVHSYNLPLLDMLIDVVKNQTGAREVLFGEEGSGDNFWPEGYIDHESDSICAPAFESKSKLAAFIFAKSSWLQTDNDNH